MTGARTPRTPHTQRLSCGDEVLLGGEKNLHWSCQLWSTSTIALRERERERYREELLDIFDNSDKVRTEPESEV